MNTSLVNNSRLDYLDAARAFALILGVVFHASLSFMPIFIGWAVMDISTSSAVPAFALTSHSFRLELFFLIAGFFSHMKFHKDKLRGFVSSRLVRIGIPFIVGWLLLRPLLVSGWLMGAESMRGEVNIWNAAKTGFLSLLDLPKDLLVGTHLWFLYYLLLISAGVLLLHFFVGLHKPTKNALTRFSDSVIEWICQSRLGFFVISVPIAACLWFMDHWGVDTPDKSLTPNIPVLLIYSGFFVFGWLLHRQKALMDHFAQLTSIKFIIGLVAVLSTLMLANFQTKPAHPQYLLIKASFMLSYAVMMWSLVSLTLGVFKHFMDRPSKVVRYIADSSYWLYLVHLPIVIWLQIAFAELALHWLIKLTGITTITLLVSLLLYDLFVRSTFLGLVLNGKKNQRVLY
ncbi:acyltransferase family protein [Pleionea sp. CnH1-48]|uniref:acyltransferase family protein n=1 Tax=Pleionea sp. CnH1-48 TaxID=2954494 RepID=UPI002097DD8C|nr:acyltransferase family protein [Pleionea sp. CnH1-48]MCO7223278.1 acyltransferase family protein [Pleionea sp. CnH1-48]